MILATVVYGKTTFIASVRKIVTSRILEPDSLKKEFFDSNAFLYCISHMMEFFIKNLILQKLLKYEKIYKYDLLNIIWTKNITLLW